MEGKFVLYCSCRHLIKARIGPVASHMPAQLFLRPLFDTAAVQRVFTVRLLVLEQAK